MGSEKCLETKNQESYKIFKHALPNHMQAITEHYTSAHPVCDEYKNQLMIFIVKLFSFN